jgi:hypothetical protein
MSHAAVGTAWTGTYFAEIISVNHNMVLVREQLTGREENLPFTDLQEIWPAPETLETFDEIAKAFDASFAYNMIVSFTRTTGWADLIKAKWSELY